MKKTKSTPWNNQNLYYWGSQKFRKVSFGLRNLPFKLNWQNYAICFIFETNLNLYFQCAIVKRKYSLDFLCCSPPFRWCQCICEGVWKIEKEETTLPCKNTKKRKLLVEQQLKAKIVICCFCPKWRCWWRW